MTDADVLVLGRGLGAYAAALSAQRTVSAGTVRLVGGPTRPFDRHTGLIDVLGDDGQREGPVPRPIAAIDSLPADHPYRILGSDALRDGLALFDDVTDGIYVGDHTEANALVPTLRGYPTPAARYPASMAGGLASIDADALLVAFQQLPDFHGVLAADRLSEAGVPFDVDGVRTQAPVQVGTEQPALALAQGLDRNDPVGPRDLPARESLARRIRSMTHTEDRIGCPAVLGLDETPAILATLEAELGSQVFEIPVGPPSVPGRRLESLLGDELRAAGATVWLDRSVDAVQTTDGTVDSVGVRNDTGEEGLVEIEADAVVLATGGLGDGGVVASRDGVQEPIFDCHVPHPTDRATWASPDPLGDHEFARFGVRIGADSRPLTAEGDAIYDNLFAAGDVVGGCDVTATGSQSGVALATGHVAGRRAANQ